MDMDANKKETELEYGDYYFIRNDSGAEINAASLMGGRLACASPYSACGLCANTYNPSAQRCSTCIRKLG